MAHLYLTPQPISYKYVSAQLALKSYTEGCIFFRQDLTLHTIFWNSEFEWGWGNLISPMNPPHPIREPSRARVSNSRYS